MNVTIRTTSPTSIDLKIFQAAGHEYHFLLSICNKLLKKERIINNVEKKVVVVVHRGKYNNKVYYHLFHDVVT